MIDNKQEERKCSEKKMGSDDGFWTVECLRGRLLAERQASRVAKEDADHLGKKLMELEVRLKEETKLRIKAEKKLKKLRKILESLKLSHNLEESDRSSSSGMSCVSSAGTSASKEEEELGPKSRITNQGKPESLDQNASDRTQPQQIHESPPTKELSSFQGFSPFNSRNPVSDKPTESTSNSHEEPTTVLQKA